MVIRIQRVVYEIEFFAMKDAAAIIVICGLTAGEEGKTEASDRYRFLIPKTRPFGSTTPERGDLAIRAVPAG